MSDPTDDVDDRVNELLAAAPSALEEISVEDVPEASNGEPTLDSLSSSQLPELAASAQELLADTDADGVLELVGLDTLPDGSEPDSVPGAIAKGDPVKVATLRALKQLATLAELDEFDEFDEETEEGTDDDPDHDPNIEDVLADLESMLERRNESAEGTQPTPDEMESKAEDESKEATADETDDDAHSELASTLEETIGGFRDDVEAAAEGLEATLGDDSDDDEPEDDSDDVKSDDAAVDADAADDDAEDEPERDEDDGVLDDNGLLGDDGLGTDSSASRKRGTMFSTVASSPSNRPDMHAVKRHSTVPKRD